MHFLQISTQAVCHKFQNLGPGFRATSSNKTNRCHEELRLNFQKMKFMETFIFDVNSHKS